jgi:hypothetical protein
MDNFGFIGAATVPGACDTQRLENIAFLFTIFY